MRSLLRRSAHLDLHPIKVAHHLRREMDLTGLLFQSRLPLLESNLRQLTGIQPIAPAVRAFVHFNVSRRAGKMSFQLYAFAPRALALPRRIDFDPFIAPDFEQPFPSRFLFLIDSLQFKRIKPNPTASSIAYIHHEGADLHLLELVETSWTFHKLDSFIIIIALFPGE